jgi:hypothetical protein
MAKSGSWSAKGWVDPRRIGNIAWRRIEIGAQPDPQSALVDRDTLVDARLVVGDARAGRLRGDVHLSE